MNPITGKKRRRSSTRCFLVVLPLILYLGCSVAGTWRVISIEPEGAEFPISRLTLDSRQRFTATGPIDGEVRTRVGTYRSSLGTLRLIPNNGSDESYRASFRWSGTCVLSVRSDAARDSVSATMVQELVGDHD